MDSYDNYLRRLRAEIEELKIQTRQAVDLNTTMAQQISLCRKALEEAVEDTEGRLRALKAILASTEKIQPRRKK